MNANGKSKVFLDITPVTVNDKNLDRWVGTRFNIAFGPCPATSVTPAAGMTGTQPAMDFFALSKMLSTTIGTNMMQFSQAVTPTGGGQPEPRAATQPLSPERVSTKIKLQSSRMHVASKTPSRSQPSGW